MRISYFFIERPVFASVISLMIIFIGLVSLLDLSVREYPKIDEPVVSVRTDYKGAAPEIIESQITKPLEDSIAGIEGIKTLSSVSRQGRSNITVRFKTYRDPDDAASVYKFTIIFVYSFSLNVETDGTAFFPNFALLAQMSDFKSFMPSLRFIMDKQ